MDTPLLKDPAVLDKLIEALGTMISRVPATTELQHDDPHARASQIIRSAAWDAGLLSGGLSLPPGPLGFVTILPDLVGVWEIQRQMVADLAGAYGVTHVLGQEQMLYCLFRHSASQAVRDLVVRVGGRLLVRRASLRAIQRILRKVGVTVTQRIVSRAVSRWLPVVGAVAVGAYAAHDTREVGRTCVELFSETPFGPDTKKPGAAPRALSVIVGDAGIEPATSTV